MSYSIQKALFTSKQEHNHSQCFCFSKWCSEFYRIQILTKTRVFCSVLLCAAIIWSAFQLQNTVTVIMLRFIEDHLKLDKSSSVETSVAGQEWSLCDKGSVLKIRDLKLLESEKHSRMKIKICWSSFHLKLRSYRRCV